MLVVVLSTMLHSVVFTNTEHEQLQELTPDQVVALVSCTVWQERAEAGQKGAGGHAGALCRPHASCPHCWQGTRPSVPPHVLLAVLLAMYDRPTTPCSCM